MSGLTEHTTALPDPETSPEFYDDTPVKRAIAWAIDSAMVWGIWLVLTVLTLGIAVLLLPLFAVIDFVYRWSSISRRSSTIGMRMVGIELRDRRGEPLDSGQAFAHTAGYMASVLFFVPQIASMGLMLASSRRQGLTDHVLGTAAVNRSA